MTVEVLSDHERPVVVKRADGDDVERLRAEGDRLRLASHPGVVQVVSSAPTAQGWELRTVHAGRPLDVAGPMDVRQVAALAVGLATTLADLHAAGIVHGRLEPAHVLVGAHGRPVLCGFGPKDTDDHVSPADDVASLGAIVVSLLGSEGEEEPIPERHWRPRRRWTGWERRALLTLADQASAEPVTRRPTARRLAAAMSEAVPTAAIVDWSPHEAPLDQLAQPTPVDPLEALRATAVMPTDRPPPRRRSVALAAVGVAALVVAFQRPGSDADAPSVSVPRPTSTSEGPTTSPPSTGLASCGPVGGVDLDGDGCRTAVVVDGQVITVGEDRFQVGERGDQVAVRDWDCDGEPTPALLRPGTGEVFLFSKWERDADLVVEPIATVAGGVDLVVAPASAACSGLAVRTRDAVVDVVRAPA